jgi:formylglycine-generating enzyme required for sulfatase activity
MIGSPVPIDLDRDALRAWYVANRERTRLLFGIPSPDAYLDRPIGLRLPIVFYDGHLPAFSFNTLVKRGLGKPSIDARLEDLFERGIDPASVHEKTKYDAVAAWPAREDVAEFARACDVAVLDALEHDDIVRSDVPALARGEAAFTILEHEEMHHETFLYILHRLAVDRKRAPSFYEAARHVDAPPAARGVARVPGGVATLGARRESASFGWDNEFGEQSIAVGPFDVDVNNVTNAEWLEFLCAGGPVPPFWRERDGAYGILGMFGLLPFMATWPVYVTQTQAAAYAAWRGGRLMSEAEYHRAAFGSPAGDERAFPWGTAAPDPLRHGNFDFKRFDPEPVGRYPEGASAFGVHDLVGNGWEWTATPFEPLPGFRPMASYPQYSADFFDGAHFVVKGASPVTARSLVRRSLRNWYRADYPYMYATFRVAYG